MVKHYLKLHCVKLDMYSVNNQFSTLWISESMNSLTKTLQEDFGKVLFMWIEMEMDSINCQSNAIITHHVENLRIQL